MERTSSRPRRLLLLADSLGNGGAERQFELLVRSLPPPWQPRVWALEGGAFAGRLRAAGAPLRIAPRRARLDPRPALDLWWLLARWRPEVVHSWGWMASLAALPACRALRIPLIDGSIRAGYITPGRRPGNHWMLRHVDAVIANSRAGLAAWSIPPERGRVVYNGFDAGRLPLCAGEPPEDGPFTAVMTARMAPGKDFAAFIEAARLLAEADGPHAWRFIAAGDGPNRPAVLAQAAPLVAAGVVELPAPSLEVLPLVRQAHVGVLLADPAIHKEGCSNTIMEYMACGLPVITTDSGGNRELAPEGETAWYIPPADGAALAAALRRLRATPEEARRLGAAGRARLLAGFSAERMARDMAVVYESVARRSL